VLRSIDNFVGRSTEFLRSQELPAGLLQQQAIALEEVAQEEAAQPSLGDTGDIGQRRLLELQKELEELEQSYEEEYGDTSAEASVEASPSVARFCEVDFGFEKPAELEPAELGFEKLTVASPPRSHAEFGGESVGPPTRGSDDGSVLLQTIPRHEELEREEQEQDDDVMIQDVGDFEEEQNFMATAGSAQAALEGEGEEGEEEEEEMELVYIRPGVYQDPASGKFYCLKDDEEDDE
jgi:hypothetical protein